MKQTAVNWLIHILKGQQDKPFTYDEWMIALEHAQAMEKEQRGYSKEDVINIVEKSRKTGLTAEYLLLTFKSE